MKQLIGIITALVGVLLIALVILQIWDIHIISWHNVLRSGITLALVGVIFVFLLIVYYNFFRDERQGYDMTKGYKAHPKAP